LLATRKVAKKVKRCDLVKKRNEKEILKNEA
jgi:hypothetical protein